MNTVDVKNLKRFHALFLAVVKKETWILFPEVY
jgi:hypothetical protein